jgi:glycosyltransferase involved in cell wall biosynthesis
VFNDMRVSVVMPAFNEETVIDAILDQVEQQPLVDEIIVVDDGSSDNTADKVAAHSNVCLVRHPYNIGNGAAVKSGIRAATGDIIVLMDCDGQHPPAEIPNILEPMDRYDMVVGARSSGTQSQTSRDVANWVFNTYASYIVGCPVKYQPFASPARIGKSKVRPLKDGLRFLMTLTRLATLFVPLKIFLPISLVFMLTGGSYTIGKLALESRFSGFGGLIASIGVFVFMLGLVSEQIALLRYINSDR